MVLSHFWIGLLYLVVTLGGARVGIWLRKVLPQDHFSQDSSETIKVGVGLIATMSALVLGLITASAKGSFDSMDGAVKQTAAQILTLDRALARFGPDAAPIRASLKKAISKRVEMIWPTTTTQSTDLDPMHGSVGAHFEQLVDELRNLSPNNDSQRAYQEKAIDVAEQLLSTRWVVFTANASLVSSAFVLFLLLWLAVTFTSFGLFAPNNATVMFTFFVCALSVASAIFLVLELDTPFDGIIRVSSAPMLYAIEHMGK